MGRVKLQIKKIENTSNRQVTFSKRRNGLIKKAYELSVLCDIDVALIMFSPSGRVSTFSGTKSIEEIMRRYMNLPEHERGRLLNQEYLMRRLGNLKCEANRTYNQAISPATVDSDPRGEETINLDESLNQVSEDLLSNETSPRVNNLETLERSTIHSPLRKGMKKPSKLERMKAITPINPTNRGEKIKKHISEIQTETVTLDTPHSMVNQQQSPFSPPSKKNKVDASPTKGTPYFRQQLEKLVVDWEVSHHNEVSSLKEQLNKQMTHLKELENAHVQMKTCLADTERKLQRYEQHIGALTMERDQAIQSLEDERLAWKQWKIDFPESDDCLRMVSMAHGEVVAEATHVAYMDCLNDILTKWPQLQGVIKKDELPIPPNPVEDGSAESGDDTASPKERAMDVDSPVEETPSEVVARDTEGMIDREVSAKTLLVMKNQKTAQSKLARERRQNYLRSRLMTKS